MPKSSRRYSASAGFTTGSSSAALNAITGARRLSRELDRQQHERRVEHLLRRVGLGVVQHAEREEQRVDALLLDRESRLLVEASQRAIERFGCRGRLQELVGVAIVERRGVVRARTRAASAGSSTSASATRHRVGCDRRCSRGRRRLAAAPLALNRISRSARYSSPEDLGRMLVDDGDGRDLRRAEVQRAVPLRQVEQLALPRVDGRREAAVDGQRRRGLVRIAGAGLR